MVLEKPKVLIIGLDGATFDLIKPWAKEGHLPTLKKLMDEGVYGPLLSTIPFATIPAWPSFATGVNPGKHGFYDFFKEKENSYEMTVETYPSRAIKCSTIWDILGQNSLTVGLVNIPGTYPPKKVNGYMITDMFTPPNACFTYPDHFQEELIKKIGDYRVFFSQLSSKNIPMLIKDLEETLQMRIKATMYLFEKDLDFIMVVDNGTDRAAHELWRFLDPDNPLFNQNELKKYGNPLLEYYKKVDEGLNVILKSIDNNTIVIIMSDHGLGPLRKFINLNALLIKEGFMQIKRNPISTMRYFSYKCGYHPKNIYKILQLAGVERLATDHVSQKTRLSLLNKIFFSTADIDWSRTKAFGCGVQGAIRINVRGREPQGCIEPGKQYEEIKNEIIEKLITYKDPENNQPMIKHVYSREEIYAGPYLNEAPDLILVPRDDYEFFGMYGFTFSHIVEPTFGNSGSHRPKGIFIALGKGIKSGIEIKDTSIMDLAPTILHIFGVPVPDYMDGKVLFEIFEGESSFTKRKPMYVSSSQAKIKERIKNLKQIGRI